MNAAPPSTVALFGTNQTRLWGLTPAERVSRMARAAGLAVGNPSEPGSRLLISSDYAFDAQWIGFMLQRPESVLTLAGNPVMAFTTDARAADAAFKGESNRLRQIAAEDHRQFYNRSLRKREEPFLEPLTPASVPTIERLSYYGAYKGVTDLLTKYLWPELALVITRLAAKAGISPNMVTAVGALGCVLATVAFWYGYYWTGMLIGFVFMVLDTVDGKLARCTITSSSWGHILDHGIDLVHPLFWWWAWAVGLKAWGLALDFQEFALVMATLVAGYAVQRAIEGIFIARFNMHIHVWRRFDSWFRLITARRNPNMVLLFMSLLFRRPDVGIVAVAWWTAISCLVHLIRLLQAELIRRGRTPITSWLEDPAT